MSCPKLDLDACSYRTYGGPGAMFPEKSSYKKEQAKLPTYQLAMLRPASFADVFADLKTTTAFYDHHFFSKTLHLFWVPQKLHACDVF